MKFKKLLSFAAAAVMTVTALTTSLSASVIGAAAADEILPDSGAWSKTSVSGETQLAIMNYPNNKLISALDGQNDIYVTFTVSGVTDTCAAYLGVYTTAGTKLSIWDPSDVSANTAGVTNTLTEITGDGTYTVALHSDTAFTSATAFSWLAVCFTTGLGSKASYKIPSAALDYVTLTDPNEGSGSDSDISGTLTITANRSTSLTNETSRVSTDVEINGVGSYSATAQFTSSNTFSEIGFFTYNGTGDFIVNVDSITNSIEPITFTGVPHSMGLIPAAEYSTVTGENPAALPRIRQYGSGELIVSNENGYKLIGYLSTGRPRLYDSADEAVYVDTITYNFSVKDPNALISDLNELITTAEALDMTKFTDETAAALTSALEAAKAITSDSSVADINTAADTLQKALNGLINKNAAELVSAIEQAKTYNKDDYKEASYTALTDAIAAGKAIVANKDAAKDDCDAAVAAINAAVEALVLKDYLTVYAGSGSDSYIGSETIEIDGTGDYSVTVKYPWKYNIQSSNLGGFALSPYPEDGPDFQIDVNSITIADSSSQHPNEYTLIPTGGNTGIIPTADMVRTDANGLANEFVKDTVYAKSEDGNAILRSDYAGRATLYVYNTSTNLYSITYNITVKELDNTPSGQCGDNAYWSLSDDGVLTITGTGDMYNWGSSSTSERPGWEEYSSSIKSVVISEGITNVGEYAFYKYSSLTDVSLPSTLTSLGKYCFCYCTALTAISIPSSVTTLGDRCFNNCTALTDVSAPASVFSEGAYCFQDCTALTNIVMPEGVESIAKYMFCGTGLTEVNLPSTLKTIGQAAFDSTALTEITIPDNVTSLEMMAFSGCKSLKTVNIGTGLTSLPEYCFYSCTALEEINIAATDIVTVSAVSEGNKASFSTANKPTFNVVKGSTTEKTLVEAGYIEMSEFPDPIVEDLEPFGYIYYGWTETPFYTGVTDESAAGATWIRLTFDCADDTSFNSYYTIPVEVNIGGTKTSVDMRGTSTDIKLGETGCTYLINLEAAAEAGQSYTLTGYTYGYGSAADYIVAITKIEFLDNDGNILDSVTAKTIAQAELEKAIAEAEAVDTSLYTEESAAALTSALEAAKAITDEAELEEIQKAAKALNDAIADLKSLIDYTALDAAIADGEAVDTSLYTDESVKALTDAVAAGKAVKENEAATQDDIDAAVKAITEAIAALETKPIVITGSVTGTIFVSDEEAETEMTVVAVSADGTEVRTTATSMRTYVLEGLEAGNYTLTISGGKYAERTYEITVEAGDNALDVYLNPLGDINGDGKVTTADVGMANSHAKGVLTLEGYQYVCANVNLEGDITTADVGMINSHAKGVKTLW